MKFAVMAASVLLLSFFLASCSAETPPKALRDGAFLTTAAPVPIPQQVHEIDERQYKDPQSRFLAQLMNRMVRATKG